MRSWTGEVAAYPIQPTGRVNDHMTQPLIDRAVKRFYICIIIIILIHILLPIIIIIIIIILVIIIIIIIMMMIFI